MYNDIKLEKGMYYLAGKNFSQALEDADPSENYSDTPLASLNAFERQLKRFDIKVSGVNADLVEKFFTTTETAVLFPEFVRLAIQQGIDESILTDIVAVSTKTQANLLKGFSISDATAYSTVTTEGNELPQTNITQGSTASSFNKIGRLITASYEAVRLERLDVFAIALKAIGIKLGNAMTKSAVVELSSGTPSIEAAGAEVTYADLVSLYGEFKDFDMTTIVASPAVVAKILKLEEMKDATPQDLKRAVLPFGPVLIKSTQIDDSKIIGLDKNYALEMAASTDLILETDKLIDRQLDKISVSISIAFKKLVPDAVRMIEF